MIFSRKNGRDGTTSWYVRYRRPDGGRKLEKVPPILDAAGRVARYPNKTDAKEFKLKRQAQVAAGTWRDPREPAPGHDGGPAFDEFADRFLAEYAKPLTRSDYYELALRPIRRYFEGKRIREITSAHLDKYRTYCFEKDRVAPATTRKRLTILGTMFRQAKRWGVVEVNPAADLQKPSEPEHRTRFLTEDEWRALEAEAAPWLREILTLAVATGGRLKEVVQLRWEDVDEARGFVTFTSENKTARSRTVAIGQAIRGVLRDRRTAQRELGRIVPWVFADRTGDPYTSRRARNRITQRAKAAMVAAGIEGASMHALRHTAGTWAAIDGRTETEIAKQLGHATTATTRRYTNLLPEHLKPLARGIDRRLVGRVAGSKTGHTKKSPEARKAHK